MNDTSDLATLIEELHALESDTFEVRDYVDGADLPALPPLLCSVCSSTSSTCA
jgi:thiazolylpeptide-type bacteriocin precursor